MTPIAVRRFTEGTWALLTEWAREITERVNSRLPTDGIEDLAVTPAKLAQVPAIALYRATAKSIPTGGAVATIVEMSDVEFSTGGLDAPFVDDTSRVVIALDGVYRVSVQLGFTPSAAPATSTFETLLCVDGAAIASASTPCVLNTNAVAHATKATPLLKGQKVDLRTYQNSGAPQNTLTVSYVRPQLCLEYIGGLS